VNCPTDDTVLQLTERQGIEIDYCPTCRGVWLDRGELDKDIERGSALERSARPGDRYDDDLSRAEPRSMTLSSSPRSSHTPRHVGQ